MSRLFGRQVDEPAVTMGSTEIAADPMPDGVLGVLYGEPVPSAEERERAEAERIFALSFALRQLATDLASFDELCRDAPAPA